MKLRFLIFFVLAMVAFGCKDLKDQQLGAYVGDSQTKVVYKNVGKNTEVVPKDRRIYFKGVDEAMNQGYTLSNEAGSETPDKSEDQ